MGGNGVSEVIISTDSRYRNIAFQTGITVKLKFFSHHRSGAVKVNEMGVFFLELKKSKE